MKGLLEAHVLMGAALAVATCLFVADVEVLSAEPIFRPLGELMPFKQDYWPPII